MQKKLIFLILTGLYCGRLETLNLDRAKTPGFKDRKRVHIANIDPFTIVESREFSRKSKSKFQADRSITYTGSLLAAPLDASDRSSLEKQSPRTLKKIDNGEQLSTDDIKKMSRAGLSDDTIMNQIHETKSVFYLSSADIVDLKKSGVSQKVINGMIQTGNK